MSVIYCHMKYIQIPTLELLLFREKRKKTKLRPSDSHRNRSHQFGFEEGKTAYRDLEDVSHLKTRVSNGSEPRFRNRRKRMIFAVANRKEPRDLRGSEPHFFFALNASIFGLYPPIY